MHARLAPSLVLLFACGDAGTATTSETDESTGETTASTSADPPPTTSTSASASTGSDGGQTDAMTDDTGLGPTSSSASTTTDNTTSSSTTASTSTTADTTTDDTTTTTTTDTTTGDPPGSCLDADFPVTAPLCGDANAACTLLRDELVSPDPKFRNDMPAIALRGDCGPAVIYSVAVNGYHGFYAERTGPDAWTSEATPMPIATGSLDAVPDQDEMLAAVDDGAYGVTVWQHANGQWTQHSALAGMNHSRAPQLVRDGQDRLHLGHIDADNNMRHDIHDGGWSTQNLLTQTEIHVRIAVDSSDAAHLIGWSSEAMTWQLMYLAPPAPPELITPLGSNVLDHHHTAIALAGADETPWVLLARKQPDQVHHDIHLAHRTGPNTWATELLFAENPGADEECQLQPFQTGQLCDYDYRRAYTTALFTSADEVRAVYAVLHYKGTLIAQCQDFPMPFCFWKPMSDSSQGELRVAWPGAAPADHQVVSTEFFSDRATGRLDTAGAMHLAYYDYPPQGGDPRVRYVMIGD